MDFPETLLVERLKQQESSALRYNEREHGDETNQSKFSSFKASISIIS